MRCLTLALALRGVGAEICFVSRELEGNLIARVSSAGFDVLQLPAPTALAGDIGVDSFAVPPHAAWLCADWRDDAAQTLDALLKAGRGLLDWLVVDHYALDARWEQAIAALAHRRMVIDDLGDRNHDCELLLDQNLSMDMQTRYDSRVPEECVRMLGPAYALLQPAYKEMRVGITARKAPVKRILVYFGGADMHGMTVSAVEACIRLRRPEIAVDVVMSSKSAQAGAVRRAVEQCQNSRLHFDLPSLAPLIASADLAVGASGATVWERLCLGLPSVIVTVAENQKGLGAALHSSGLARLAGHFDVLGPDGLFAALSAAVDDQDLEAWSTRCLKACDGLGTGRVVGALIDPP
jgi:UDP-2,4-diacetamido-2,4,6-trideoxy-beta-L-altropyranose hydrolase